MSFNASVQMVGSALASLTAGLVVTRAPDGTLLHFGAVGWLAASCTLLCVLLARRIQVVPDTSLQDARERAAGRV
jgi:predicted MFS family arabinose efflux permease